METSTTPDSYACKHASALIAAKDFEAVFRSRYHKLTRAEEYARTARPLAKCMRNVHDDSTASIIEAFACVCEEVVEEESVDDSPGMLRFAEFEQVVIEYFHAWLMLMTDEDCGKRETAEDKQLEDQVLSLFQAMNLNA